VTRLVLRRSLAIRWAAVVPTRTVSCVNASSVLLGVSVTLVSRATGTFDDTTLTAAKVNSTSTSSRCSSCSSSRSCSSCSCCRCGGSSLLIVCNKICYTVATGSALVSRYGEEGKGKDKGRCQISQGTYVTVYFLHCRNKC